MNADLRRLLVAVDDSAAALRAVDIAVRLAATTGAEVRFVHVTGDGALRRALSPSGEGELPDRVGRGVEALLDHVAGRARQAGVACSVGSLFGEPEAEVVTEARAWGADLVVIGRSQSGAVGQPYVGHVTRHILEFSEAPVLVVPRPRAAVSGRSRLGAVSPG
jgi:nucleotide-binding universal stress UspA family protein